MTTAGSNFMKTSNKIVGDKNKRNARQTITTHSKYLDQQFSTLDGPGAGHRVSSKKHVRANSTAPPAYPDPVENISPYTLPWS